MAFEPLFANPNGRTSRGHFLGGLIVLLAVVAFYYVLVKGRTGEWCLLILLFPATVLHARRLHDMGRTAWLLLAPVGLFVALAWLHMSKRDPQLEAPLTAAALAVAAAFVLWGLLGKGQAEANRFG